MIFVYDVTNPQTFETTPGHFADACRYISSKGTQRAFQFLVGNKTDLKTVIPDNAGQVSLWK